MNTVTMPITIRFIPMPSIHSVHEPWALPIPFGLLEKTL